MLRSLVAFTALANSRLRRLAVRRKLADAYWCRSHAHCRHGRAPPVCKTNPNLNQRPPRVLFCLKLNNSCCYARYSSGNNCNIVVKLVQKYHCFWYIFLPGKTSVEVHHRIWKFCVPNCSIYSLVYCFDIYFVWDLVVSEQSHLQVAPCTVP